MLRLGFAICRGASPYSKHHGGSAGLSATWLNKTRSYHSYPDPKEKPVISQSRSNEEKKLDKSKDEFKLANKFKLDAIFPGTPTSKGIGVGDAPATKSTVLSNGITVASQDMPGLMSSFAVIVRAGGSYETQEGADCDMGATHMLELNGFRSTKNRGHQEVSSGGHPNECLLVYTCFADTNLFSDI